MNRTGVARVLRAVFRVGVPALVVAASGCILKTDIVGAAFNGGALDSNGDPFRVPSQLAASRVERIVEQEVADGYFRQGADGEVGGWLDAQARDVSKFVDTVNSLNRQGDADAGASATATERAQTTKKRHDKNVSTYTAPPTPICKGVGKPSPALPLFLDDIRFKEATWRAARRVAALKLEGLVDDTAVRDGAQEAFTRASRYLKNRKWTRRPIQKTAGLAIEGGAASGIFSAGAVWVVLSLINGWMAKTCPPGDAECAASRDVRFRLVSGTSTGAMVAVAVDRFNSMVSSEGRQAEIDNVAKWFTCFSFTDLMCVQSTGIDHLLGGANPLHGVLKFDGIEKVLTSCVKPWMFDNTSELILNTTEFRSGRIFALSDQNEMTKRADVVHASLASALLPIIGEPDTDVSTGVKFDPPYDPSAPERTRPAYLDGGIRSELPILPLVRRGAERILAVASGASMISEVKRLDTALDVAPRYININTGSVTETELEYAQRVAESARQAEIASCMGALEENPQLCEAADCNAWNVCHDDLAHACQSDTKTPAEKRKEEDRQTLAQRCEPFWKMETIFVDATSVDGLSGYNFQPSELRRLFRAGAEAARVRCLDLSRLLGILPESGATSAELVEVNQWCAPALPSTKALCGKDVPAPTSTFVARACLDPLDLTKLPKRLDACPVNEVPK